MVVDVSLEIGQSPNWIMTNYTLDQLVMTYKRHQKNQLSYVEMQSAIVCSMLAGKYKPAKEKSIDDLANMGLVEDTV